MVLYGTLCTLQYRDMMFPLAVSAQDVRNQAHEIGMFVRAARKKLYVNKVNRSKRFEFAKEMLQKPLDFWQTVI